MVGTVSSQRHLPPRAAKQRRKGDRLVIACQEQTFWLVHRPPVSPVWGWGGLRTAVGSCWELVCLAQTAHADLCFEPVGRTCLLGSWWVTGGSSYVAHPNPETTRPGLAAPHSRTPGQTNFSPGLRERHWEAEWGS